MKTKIMVARSMSRILFCILYIADVYIIYCVTKDIPKSCIGAAGIWLVLLIQMWIHLLSLKAHSLNNSSRADVNYIQGCMEEVVRRSDSIGRKTYVRLWVADNESLNCFTVGHNIIVNKGLLRLGDRSMIEGCLCHEYSHVLNGDYFFAALLNVNIFIGLSVLGIIHIGAAAVIVLVAALVFGIIFSSWIGYIMGSVVGKGVKKMFGLFMRLYYYIFKIFSAFLYRVQENEADRYVGILRYSGSMISFLHLSERMERHSVQTSWVEDLLNDHPSKYRRIVRLERIEEEISGQERMMNPYQMIHHDNPF